MHHIVKVLVKFAVFRFLLKNYLDDVFSWCRIFAEDKEVMTYLGHCLVLFYIHHGKSEDNGDDDDDDDDSVAASEELFCDAKW